MNHKINPLQQHHLTQLPLNKKANENPKTDFKHMLINAQDVKVSKHAKQRLIDRNIHINDKQWQTISTKMQEAKQKGITDSVVITQEAALLVSTKNNTVVTAMNRDEAANRIFTNINGTILIND